MVRRNRPRGTDNVLADLGFDDAEELSAKAVLAVKLNFLIEERRLSQIEAARIKLAVVIGKRARRASR